MTDITDKDKREARKWAEQTIANSVNSPTDPWVIAARLFLANEEPPAPTLAEGLAHIAEHWEEWATEKINTALTDATIHAKQVEHDLAEARAEAKTWREQDENDCEMYMEELASARAEVERLTAERDTQTAAPDQQSNSLKTPNSSFKSSLKEPAQNPADVPSGEPWIVEVDGEQRTAVRAAQYHRPWSTFTEAGSVVFAKDPEITLVSRFVPAQRVITDPDELDGLPEGSIVRDNCDGEALQKINGRWIVARKEANTGYSSHAIVPVTVLWEAGE